MAQGYSQGGPRTPVGLALHCHEPLTGINQVMNRLSIDWSSNHVGFINILTEYQVHVIDRIQTID